MYLYASKRPGDDSRWKKLGFEPGELPAGVIVGSVEIVDCKYFEDGDYYGYKLKNPRRYKKHLAPNNQPQPCFFFPFGEVKGRRPLAKQSSGKQKRKSIDAIVLEAVRRSELLRKRRN